MLDKHKLSNFLRQKFNNFSFFLEFLLKLKCVCPPFLQELSGICFLQNLVYFKKVLIKNPFCVRWLDEQRGRAVLLQVWEVPAPWRSELKPSLMFQTEKTEVVSLLPSGDSFTHFRFSEEKDWEMDAITAAQVNSTLTAQR